MLSPYLVLALEKYIRMFHNIIRSIMSWPTQSKREIIL